MTWQTMDTAPRDGTRVDLWMVNQDGDQWRETDAYFVKDTNWEYAVWPDSGGGVFRPVSNYTKRDGWWAPNHEYEGQDGWCDAPAQFNDHPRQMKTFFTRPTHWMPIPAPPAQETTE